MEGEDASGLQTLKEPHAIGLSVLVNPDRPTLDIVFVHGFTGHPKRTWTHKGEVPNDQYGYDDDDAERPSKFRKLLPSTSSPYQKSGVRKAIYWPRDLVPSTVPNARVLTYGYDTHIRHWLGSAVNKSTIYDIAWDFLLSLETARRLEPSRPLLFVAHSLGGIVVKEALRRSRGCEMTQKHLRGIYESTSGIIFFGTPHGGADPRGLMQHIVEKCIRAAGFSVNEQIINTLLPSSERLRELREEFSPMARQKEWIVYSFQEQYGIKALNGNKVVEDTASCLNDPGIEVTQPIASNHMDMCRFSGQDDVEYGKVVGALQRVLEAITKLAPLCVRSVLNADQRRSYVNSLWFDQIDARHATIKTAHAKTCTWLLSKSEYQDWLDVTKISEHNGFLWIKGKPGTGKSTIMKFAYAHARKKKTDVIIISFFFNARGEHLERSALGMYQSLLYQLLQKIPELETVFDSLEPKALSGSDFFRWDIEMVKNLFGHAIEKLGQRCLTCFIDALDECEEDQVREMVAFFEHLGQLAVSSQFRFLVCFSSRHYPHITIEKGIQLILEGQEGHQQDIANYLHSELKAGRSKLIEQIKAEILERASGIFLWVVLVVQVLNKEYADGRIHALRKRLGEIPDGLDNLFKDILTRDGRNMEELILCLQWILYAKRPLKREELYYAILAGVEPEAVTAWNPEEITNQDMDRFLLSSSKGLAEVTKSKAQTVQFIHESVRDFLLKGDGLSRLRSDLGSNFLGLGHERLKQCCQNYMMIDFSEHLPSSELLPIASSDEAANLRRLASEKFPFLGYAVRNVLHHADAADGYGVSQDGFVESFPLGDWITLDNLFERYQIRRHTPNGSLLYILAEQNLPNLIRIELRRVPHMDIEGERYGFPLFAALAHANENAVKALLIPDTGAWSDSDAIHNRPSCSTKRGYQEAIGCLLQNGRDISTQKEKTVLSWAAERGDIALVKVLLATKKIDVNSSAPKFDRTALSWAAEKGHEAVVKLLLDTGKANVDAEDSTFGQTPLSWAAEKGKEAVVKLLLDTGKANVDYKDSCDQTPLLWAAGNGHEAVVKLLLDTGKANVDSKDSTNGTPLSQAAESGHEAVVKLLLDTGKVNVDSKDSINQMPLWRAAENGHEVVVKLLLDTGKANVDSKDSFYGQTPLSRAAQNGHEATVKLLLDTGKVDLENKDSTYGRTPLSWAAEKGNEAVVKLLLDTGKVNTESYSKSGQTPLSWAAENGHKAVVKLLLDTGKVNLDPEDFDGRTPLSRAAGKGHEMIMKLLLDTGKVNMDSYSNSGQTPLSWAAKNGHEAVVKLLLDAGKVNMDSEDIYGWTPLSWAVKGGHKAVAKLLTPAHAIYSPPFPHPPPS